MKVILPKFDDKDSMDLSALTTEHFVVASLKGKPFGVLCTDSDNVEYWIQTSMQLDAYPEAFNTIYEAIEDFVQQYPNITFEAYL